MNGSNVGTPKPRNIEITPEYQNDHDAWHVLICIPKERIKADAAIQNICEEIAHAVKTEAAKSFHLMNEYGQEVKERGE